MTESGLLKDSPAWLRGMLELSQLLLALSLPVVGWMFNEMNSNASRLTTLEATRPSLFTVKDGQEVWKEISAIRQDIATLRIVGSGEKIDALVKSIGELNTRVSVMARDIDQIKQEVKPR